MAPASAPALPPIQQVGTRDRLAGHAGHLSEEQEKVLQNFKEKLQKEGYYTPAAAGTVDDDAEPSHDDSTLLRFLRARKFELEPAYLQFTSTENWRRTNHVASLYDSFPVSEFSQAQKVYPQWTGRRDKAGLPVYVYKISGLTKELLGEYQKGGEKRLGERMIALYEHMVQFALPFCTAVPHSHQETPISATTTIVDISNVSLARFWALRSHMQRASTLATANYAETLGTIYIVGAPNFFSVVWGWIGKWFDPGTVEKIFILSSHEVLPVLSRFIEPTSIPKQFGGSLDWTYGVDGPKLDEDMQETLGLEILPRGSVRWVKGEGLVLKGAGRSDEEVKEGTPVKKKEEGVNGKVANGHADPVAVAAPAPTPIVTPAPAPDSEAATAAEVKQEEVKSGDVEGEKQDIPTEGEHTIWTTAKEEPAAPVKELAAALEGTTS